MATRKTIPVFMGLMLISAFLFSLSEGWAGWSTLLHYADFRTPRSVPMSWAMAEDSVLTACSCRKTERNELAALIPIDAAWKLGRAALDQHFGSFMIRSEYPFSVVDVGDRYWFFGYLPPGADGGTAFVIICKNGGRIVSIGHGK